MSRRRSLWVVGLGPGPAHWMTPEADEAIAEASDVVGYGPYLDRLPLRAGPAPPCERQPRRDRSRAARASPGCGGPQRRGRLRRRSRRFRDGRGGVRGGRERRAGMARLDDRVAPGVSAMQAAAARLGAPLGHDFCAISLSDNLKPWDVVARRLDAAAEGDFVIALYNPASKARPRADLRSFRSAAPAQEPATTPVAFARAIGRAGRAHRADRSRRGRSRHRRHEHARADRLERDALHRARRRAAVAADAAHLRGGAMSLDPGERLRRDARASARPAGLAGRSTMTTEGRDVRAASIFA